MSCFGTALIDRHRLVYCDGEMGSKLVAKGLVLSSVVLLLLCGKSTLQCRSCIRGFGKPAQRWDAALAPLTPISVAIPSTDRETLRLEDLEFKGLPSNLLITLMIAAVVGLLGGVQYWGTFEPIRLADASR